MEKTSNDLLHLTLLSLLTGAGTYTGARALKDITTENKPKPGVSDELELTLPASRFPKQANEQEPTSVMSYLAPLLLGAGGLGTGFFGASGIYEKLQNNKIDKEKQQINNDYLNSLSQAHAKVAEAKTPHVDQLIEGFIAKIGEELQKQAFDLSDLSNLTSFHNKPSADFVGSDGVLSTVKNISTKGVKSFMDTELGKITGAGMLAALIGSAGATYGIAKKMDSEGDETKNSQKLPTSIRLNVH